MRSRLSWLLPLIAFAPLLMAPSGGFPTQPTFQTVTVNSLPTNAISVTASSSLPGFYLQAASGQSAQVSLSGNGNTEFSTDLLINQDSTNAANIINRAAGTLVLGTSNATRMTIASGGAVTVATPGTANPALTINGNAGAFTSQFNNNGAGVGVNVTNAGAGTGFQVNWPAATAGNMIAMQQTSQDGWSINQPASSNNLQLSDTGSGSNVVFNRNGGVTFSGVAGTGSEVLVVNGTANAYAEDIRANSTSGQSFGLLVFGGTTSADFSAKFLNQAGSTQYMTIAGDGSVQVGAPTGGNCGLGCLNAQSLRINNAVIAAPTFVVSNSATTRTSTTTQSCDANLTNTTTWGASKLVKVHAVILWSQGAVNTNGIRLDIGVTGTAAVESFGLATSDNTTSSNGAENPLSHALGGANGYFGLTNTASTNPQHTAVIDSVVSAASSGSTTICISWSQNASSASATTISANSFMELTQIN